MLYAIDKADNKISALPNLSGFCPTCKNKMISKCGSVRVWHWSHSSKHDCDSWAATPESDWHRSAKSLFPKEWCEVIVLKQGIRHRADIKLPDNTVIEFQKTWITKSQITERSDFYDKVLWVFDASKRQNRLPDFHKDFTCLYTKDSLLTLESKLYYDFQKPEIYCTFKDILDNPGTALQSIFLKPKEEIQKEVSQPSQSQPSVTRDFQPRLPTKASLIIPNKLNEQSFLNFQLARQIRENYLSQFEFAKRAKLRANWERNFQGRFDELYPKIGHLPIEKLCSEKLD